MGADLQDVSARLMSALTFATAQLLRVLPRAGISRAMGRLADHAWSPPLGRAVISLYSRFYDVSFDECEKAEGFQSFDEFFTRSLKDGARPIDPDPFVVVSPADGRVDSMGRIERGSRFMVKGRPYLVEELVGDPEEAARYEGGGGCVVYLSPRDYHRVHAPADGVIHHVRSLPGDYYPVNSIGMEHVPNLFVRNRRVSIAIDTPSMGRITAVMVVAIVVGRITVSGIDERDVPLGYKAFDPSREVRRGDEIGVFHLGSTVVLLLEQRALGTWLADPGPVLYGQRLARAASATNGGRGA
jgi:phosphatidylserine decarboxylase